MSNIEKENILDGINHKIKAELGLFKVDGTEDLLDLFHKVLITVVSDERLHEFKIAEFKKIEYKSFDNKKIAGIYYINPKPTNKWIVGLHGYCSMKEHSVLGSYYFESLGYNIFAFDFRNHGDSDDAQTTLGTNEQKDLEATLDFVKSKFNPESIGLIGFSMGAHVLNRFALSKKATDYNIKFGISDGPYFVPEQLINQLIRSREIPITGDSYDQVVENTIEEYKKTYNIDIRGDNPERMIPLCEKTFPILFLHTKEDKITDYQDSENFYNLRKGIISNDELHIFETGEHCTAIAVHNKTYTKLIEDFIKNK